uniref:Uncharacterized protein n=1 Tax=Sphaerodactylus townsendi TaxID=933632 RepID=A0ACB8FST6_9SAUR
MAEGVLGSREGESRGTREAVKYLIRDGGELPTEDILLAKLSLKRIVQSCHLEFFLPADPSPGHSHRVGPNNTQSAITVTLIPAGKPKFAACFWYRDEQVESKRIFAYIPSYYHQDDGPAFTGRETPGPNCSLTISRLTLNDTGIYIVRKTLVGEWLDKPTVSAFPCRYAVEFKNSVNLTCENLSGPATVRWFKNSRPVGESVRINLTGNNRTLSIPNITRDDAGRYQCQLSDSENTEISDVKYVDVIYGPEIPVIHPPESLYREHSDLRLTCKAETIPDARYIWFCNGMQCGTRSELIIRDITVKHSGNYVCQAVNVLSLQKRNKTQEIEVERIPVRDVTVTGPSVATEDQPVTLMCTSAGSSVSYSWFKGGQSLEPGYHILLTNNTQNLTLDPSHRSHSGIYTCKGSNSISSASSEPHRLDILYGPDPPIIHDIIDLDRSKFHLSCRAESNPAPSYIWFLNRELLPDQPSVLVMDLAKDNGGNYTCQAENRSTQQKRNSTFEIEVIGQWRNTSIK